MDLWRDMKIAVGCDHAGFPLKDTVIEAVKVAGHEVIDVGAYSAESSDFPDFVKKVGEKIQSGEAERGILICGSGIGAICRRCHKASSTWRSLYMIQSKSDGNMHS